MKLRRRFLWRREGAPPTELVVEARREGKARVHDGETTNTYAKKSQMAHAIHFTFMGRMKKKSSSKLG